MLGEDGDGFLGVATELGVLESRSASPASSRPPSPGPGPLPPAPPKPNGAAAEPQPAKAGAGAQEHSVTTVVLPPQPSGGGIDHHFSIADEDDIAELGMGVPQGSPGSAGAARGPMHERSGSGTSVDRPVDRRQKKQDAGKDD